MVGPECCWTREQAALAVPYEVCCADTEVKQGGDSPEQCGQAPPERWHVRGSETMVPLVLLTTQRGRDDGIASASAHPSGTLSFRLSVAQGVRLSEAGAGTSAVTGTMLPAHETRLMLTHEGSLQISEDSLYPFFPIRPSAPRFLNISLVTGVSHPLAGTQSCTDPQARSAQAHGSLASLAVISLCSQRVFLFNLKFWQVHHF